MYIFANLVEKYINQLNQNIMEPLKIATVQFETRDNDKVYNTYWRN